MLLTIFQCVPYLISMCTDTEQSIRVKADQQLQEIEKKYPGFIHVSIQSSPTPCHMSSTTIVLMFQAKLAYGIIMPVSDSISYYKLSINGFEDGSTWN